MPTYWVDVLDSSGIKQGAGPLTSVTDWTHTAMLDRAGVFAFTMSADDPRRDLLRIKRQVRCWTANANGLQVLGQGIINDITQTVTSDGRAIITVTGEDLLAELATRIIPLETLNETVALHPARAGYQIVYYGVTYSQPTWIDGAPGDTTTGAENNGNAVHIYAPFKFSQVNVVLTASNMPNYNSGGIAEYWDGADWIAFDVTTNTTMTSTADWFAQSGYITWDDGAISWPEYPNPNYQIRFRADTGGWLAFTISDITLTTTQPTTGALAKVMAFAPNGWGLDAANGYTETASAPLVGVELISNGGFETYTGTEDDTTTDDFDDWTETETSANSPILAITTDKHGGDACLKLVTGASYSDAYISQTVTVEPDTDYTLVYWTKGDGGSGQVAVSLHDADESEYDGRFYYADSLVTAATWTRKEVNFTTSPGCESLRVVFWNSLATSSYALVDDVSLMAGGGGAISLEVAGETVLENLVRIADTTGEHFIMSPSGRQVLWLGHDVRSSGLRCIAAADTTAAETRRDIALITRLAEAQTGANLVSRVYAHGGGRDPVPTLRNTRRQAPTGYTLNKTSNYLERDASVSAYGVIERRIDVPDVTNITGDVFGDIHGSNMLFDRAYAYLRRNSATALTLDYGDVPRTYDLELVKCDRIILPGYTVHLEYDRYTDGYRRLHIDGDMWVLSATVRADATGVHTVALQCGTTDSAPRTEAGLIASMLRQQRAMQAHGVA